MLDQWLGQKRPQMGARRKVQFDLTDKSTSTAKSTAFSRIYKSTAFFTTL
jgi:hypothetical protein